jgi:hypothetical protein
MFDFSAAQISAFRLFFMRSAQRTARRSGAQERQHAVAQDSTMRDHAAMARKTQTMRDSAL